MITNRIALHTRDELVTDSAQRDETDQRALNQFSRFLSEASKEVVV